MFLAMLNRSNIGIWEDKLTFLLTSKYASLDTMTFWRQCLRLTVLLDCDYFQAPPLLLGHFTLIVHGLIHNRKREQ